MIYSRNPSGQADVANPNHPGREGFRRPIRLSRKGIGGRSHFEDPMPPGGWRSMPNPDGAGFLLVQDRDRIDYGRGMAARVPRGDSICSVVQWLNLGAALGPRLLRRALGGLQGGAQSPSCNMRSSVSTVVVSWS